jgi:hypothetical protein
VARGGEVLKSKRKNHSKLYIDLLLLSILLVYAVYSEGAIFYHESLNQAIYAQYGVNSRIQLWLPFTHHQNTTYWLGYNESYVLGDTYANQTQLNNLRANNTDGYDVMMTEILINENPQSQSKGYNLFVYPVVILYGICVILECNKLARHIN